MPSSMDSERSSKRRKLNEPPKLPAPTSAAAKLAELRRSKSTSKAALSNGVSSDSIGTPKLARGRRRTTAVGSSEPLSDGKRREGGLITEETDLTRGLNGVVQRVNGDNSVDEEEEQAQAHLGSAKKGQVDVAATGKRGVHSTRKNEGQDSLHSGSKHAEGAAIEETPSAEPEDVVVADADDSTKSDVENEESQPRTSGRKRQMSRKMQEAIKVAVVVPTSKPKPVKRTLEDEMKAVVSHSRVEAVNDSDTPKKPGRRRQNGLPNGSDNTPQAPTQPEVPNTLINERETPGTPTGRLKPTPKPTKQPTPRPAKQSNPKPTKQPTAKPVKQPKVEVPKAQVAVSNGASIDDTTESPQAAAHPVLLGDDTESRDELDEVAAEDATLTGEEVSKIQQLIMERLTGRASSPLVGLKDEYAKISSLVEQTIVAGESNSMVIIGARGSGKTAIVDRIIQTQGIAHQGAFHTVRLSGFVHTDDKIALREIWRQLGKEMEVGDDHAVKNYADTLTTLLALLSHPSELGNQEVGHAAKSVIFILDEFELFASHPRQTLLYNLFDIAQSRKAPIAVLGFTTRFDVAESLEKRVKSRFSHRQVHIPLAKTFGVFRDSCKSSLLVQEDDLQDSTAIANGILHSKLVNAASGAVGNKTALKVWNAMTNSFFTKSETLTAHLERIYYTSKSVPDFHSSMLLPVASISDRPEHTVSSILTHFENTLTPLKAPDSKLTLLHSLSTLQTALLISAARLSIIHDTDTVTFALAYDEYKTLASRARIQASALGAMATGTTTRVWSKEAAGRAWEGLVALELVMPVSEYRSGREGGICRVDVGLEEIGLAGVELGGMGKWCREI